MTGEEWLELTLTPALRRVWPPYEQLRGEVFQLAETGVLSGDQASHALARLEQDERERSALVRGRTERAAATARGSSVQEDRLQTVMTPEASLGEVKGLTVVLRRVELWTWRLLLQLEARQNALTDALDSAFEKEWERYERGWIEHRRGASVEERDLRSPGQPSTSRLAGLPLSVQDDLGTRYHVIGTATGGPHAWRSDWRLEPGVPGAAGMLRIAIEDGAAERPCLELALARG